MSFVNLSIEVDGKEWALPPVNHLSIKSSYHNHHQFEIIIPLPVNSELYFSDIKEVKGKYIQIDFNQINDSSKVGKFVGIIEEVITRFNDLEMGQIHLKGFSPGVILDGATSFDSYNNIKVTKAIERILKPYRKGNFPKIEIENFSDEIDWILQFDSDYQMIESLAEDYGKVFYYDGTKFFFGKLKSNSETTVKLEMNKNLQELNVFFDLAPIAFEVKGHDYTNGKEYKEESGKIFTNDLLLKSTIEKSIQCYPKTSIYINRSIKDQKDLKRIKEKIMVKQAHQLLTITSKSTDPSLKIGSVVCFDHKHSLLKKELTNRKFIITKIEHNISEESIYSNTFEAVPADIPYAMPMHSGRRHTSGALKGKVINIEDPLDLGRVKAEIIGTRHKSESIWLRTLSPTTKNGGFQCIPQVGETVLLFFEDLYHPEQSPFVLGSYRNENTKLRTDPKFIGLISEEHGVLLNKEKNSFSIWGDLIEIISEKLVTEGKDGTYISCNKAKKPNFK